MFVVKCIYCNFENPDEYTYCIHCSKRLEFSNVDNFKFNHSITQEDNLSNNTLKQLYHKFLEEKYNTIDLQTKAAFCRIHITTTIIL